MTIIAKGLSTNVPLAAGQQITVKPLGQSAPTVTIRAVSGGAIQIDTTATLGSGNAAQVDLWRSVVNDGATPSAGQWQAATGQFSNHFRMIV